MTTDVSIDRAMMLRAIELARRGEGCVEPNPMVGCVIVQQDEIVGEGFHARFGGPHAEIEALRAADQRSRGATLYVSLEPCCHQGKTPPCTAALLRSGVRRVVVAQVDPFPHVSGKGIEQLRAGRVDVEVGLCQAEAEALNAPYRKRIRTGLPWVIAKWAMTLDGKIASRTGDSRWISSEASRRIVHQLRGRMDAILVGKRTVLYDNPQLTARPAGPRLATRIVLDSTASLALDCQLVATARDVPVLVAAAAQAPDENVERLRRAGCEVWLGPEEPVQRTTELLRELSRRGMTNVLVEGGGELLGRLFDEKLVDEIHVFIAPKILGGAAAVTALSGRGAADLASAVTLTGLSREFIEQDVYVHGRIIES